jgi:lysophospholipase L1-like esterase
VPIVAYSRYVAIGDSQTEGLWDGDDSAGLVGFADRLAAMIDAHYPGLQYANLAVRGRRVGDVLNDQLAQALSMRPDLITICIGMNDVTRPGPSFDRALADLDRIYAQLAESGATIATTTFPDITQILPVGRLLAGRVTQINAAITGAADRYGFRLVDLFSAASMKEPDTWSSDRVHGSPKGTCYSPPRPPRRWDYPAATMIGPTKAAPLRGRRYGPGFTRRRCGPRTC